MKKKNWYPLDNAAKIFPAVYGEKRPYNFCVSALLTEKIVPETLETAVNNILLRVPTFKTKLKRGLFWYFLEENKLPFCVESEVPNYLGLINFQQNNDYLFKIYYRERKVSMVCFHALTDANGALGVFKEILFEYLNLLGKKIETDGMIKTKLTPDSYKERDDNYVTNFKKGLQKPPRPKRLAHSDGTPFDYDGFGLITAKVDLKGLKEVAKKHAATLTEYLTGVYMYVFYNNYVRGKNTKNKNVCILVPLDMRTRYESESLRNFSLFIRVTHYFDKELPLDECVEIAKEYIKKGSQGEMLDSINYFNVSVEKNVLLKLVPLFLKDLVMRMGYYFEGENIQSGDISNLGLVKLPKDMAEYVEDLNFSISASHTSKQLVAVIGYKDSINITFTRNFVENAFEKDFIAELVSAGLTPIVNSNYWEKKQ